MQARSIQKPAEESYTVRPYRPSDRDQFLSLYADVWGTTKDTDWFEWRFERNPYRDGVQMVVVECDGELVAAEPLLPFRLRIRETTVDAYQPVDWIVHPDHRRRGLFTRMTERLLDRFGPDAELLFNFPNDQLLPGLQKFGWRTVSTIQRSYRVQNARRLSARQWTDQSPAASGAAMAGDLLVSTALRVLDRVDTVSKSISVERYDDVPVDIIEEVYTSAVPERFHLARDRGYLRWRFDNPRWETNTYVARRDGQPVGTLVTGRERTAELDATFVLDAQPMCPTTDPLPDVFKALLSAAVADSKDDDLVVAPSNWYPEVLRQCGFWSDKTFPLSRMASPMTHAVRPLPGADGCESWHLDDHVLTDPDNWTVGLADLDLD
ncbi:GNAT family N-acetyltransferase [Haloarchaeobius sp. DFWS5]|uniref:GNAT family N-acetyltransferase n=1 Tax=Haloarchaeobius sp. DFWS5 TaxID=3446114 RepID=UPI003EBD214F